MPAPLPPIPFKDHCSIIHDNVLYVYSPQALQTLSLEEGAKWSQEENGISVTGAACVKGGVDGDNSRPALYVVGGIANGTNDGFSGLQRYSIQDKSWETIDPVVRVTQHRSNHGATYINASSTILIYGGSQDDYEGYSTQTFLMDTFPPYRVQAYNSVAPPTIKPFMLPWSEDRALMVGGSPTNQNVFTFGPADAWQDIGLALPESLPQIPQAQAAIFNLPDGSRILQTFNMDQVPMSVTTNVLLNSGGGVAQFNVTVGQPTSSATDPVATSARVKRQASGLADYPAYDASDAPQTARNGFSIAQGDDGLIAFVGGDADGSVEFFNQAQNSWVQPTALLGDQPQTSSSATPTSSRTPIPTSSPSSPPSSDGNDSANGMVILGGVLGGICGFAAVLIIILLILRNFRRSKKKEMEKARESFTPDSKAWENLSFEEGGMRPLARQGQPMGRSPVVSTIEPEQERARSTMLAPRVNDKGLIRRVSAEVIPMTENLPEPRPSFSQGRSKQPRGPLTISRPMNPDLGHYNVRPSIDLGMATPASPINATALVTAASAPQRNRSQRKTDEAWGKYFAGEAVNPTLQYGHGRAKSRDSQGFWPGAGVTEKSSRPPNLNMRDSVGKPLQAKTVAAASPTFRPGPSTQAPRGVPARISNGDSVSSDGEYEDQALDGAFSSGIPASIHDTWSPVDSSSSSQPRRNTGELAPPTASSMKTSHSSGTNSSGIPNFPMPTPSARSLRHSGGASTLVSIENVQVPSRRAREPSDYFGAGPGRDGMPQNNDMSWLNLGQGQGQDQNR